MTPDAATADGRRARNMRDKQDRIFRAAADLFAERGFESVSTGAGLRPRRRRGGHGLPLRVDQG